MISLCITGALGRMGQSLIKQAAIYNNTQITVGLIRQGHTSVGIPITTTDITYSDNIDDAFKEADLIIDFTTPDATLTFLDAAYQHKKPIVLGTTNLCNVHHAAIEKLSTVAPIIMEPNFALGMHVFFALMKQAAEALPQTFDTTITETHHHHKKDAPSGTAKVLANQMQQFRHVEITSLRTGNNYGEHVVSFNNAGEHMTFAHKALSRDIFAQGALDASLWLVDKPPGQYSVKNILGLS